MSKSGRFFERAELDPTWPISFLIAIVGMLLAIFEGSLGLWSLMYGGTPMLSLIFLFWAALHHEKYVMLFSGFIIGLTSDLLFSDLIGGRATAFIVVLFLLNFRRQKLLQGDFLDMWLEFSLAAIGVVTFQLVIFSALDLAVPALTPVIFQIGVTMILFPIGYVILASFYLALLRISA